MAQYVGPFEEPDRYELVELRARGGEGELWRATITVDGQALAVAVKVIHPVGGQDLGEWTQRWRRQSELLRSLEHPGLVRVREVFEGPSPHGEAQADTSTRSLYLVMNWVEGESLVEWVGRNPERDPLDCSRITSRLAAAIAYLHSGDATGGVPVLHQDIKPANVIVDGADVRLVDFGFARLLSPAAMTLAGTPAYLAPEILAGAPATEASDRFGLGATSYFLFTGEDPNVGDYSAMRARLEAVRGISDRDGFAEHVIAMMARDPLARPAGVVDWAQALAVGAVSQRFTATAVQPVVRRTTRRRSRRRRVVAAVVILVLVAAGGAAFALTKGGDTSSSSSAPPKTAAPASDSSASDSSASDTSATDATATSPNPTGPTLMPNVVGTQLDAATTILNGDGATIKTIDVLDTNDADGTVISQTPAAGAAFATAVTLRVARQPVITFLADTTPVADSGNATAATATLSGVTYTHAVTQTFGSQNNAGLVDTGYDLGRHYLTVKATVGEADDFPANTHVEIQVYGDGRLLFQHTVTLGQAIPLNLDVTGVLRLDLDSTLLDQNSSPTHIVWGDIQVQGEQSAVPTTTTSTSF